MPRFYGLLCITNQSPKANSAFYRPWSVNEDQLRLGRQKQVWFIPLAYVRGCAGETVRSLEIACHT